MNNSSAPLYNSRLIDTYIKLIRLRYSYININDLLEHARMESYQVEDEGYWFTQEQINLFYEKLEMLTGNKNIAREAGRFAASPGAIGMMRHYILGFIGPAKAYGMIGMFASNFTRSSKFKTKLLGKNKIEVTVSQEPGAHERPFQCENRIGYLEAIATIFNCKLPRIEHTECMFKGAAHCTYNISWRDTRSSFWKSIRNYSTAALNAVFLPVVFLAPKAAIIMFPVMVCIIMALTLYAAHLEKTEINTAVDSLRESTEVLMDQFNTNYSNMQMINEIGIALSSKQNDMDSVLGEVVRILEKRLDYDRGMILLADNQKRFLKYKTGFGYDIRQYGLLSNTYFHIDKKKSRGSFVVSFREQKPILINDLDEIKEDLSAKSLLFARKMGVKSFLCCPIIYGKESLGILAVDNIRTKRPLLQSDVNVLMGIAPAIGSSIHNALLVEKQQMQFRSIIRVLGSSIEARDPITAGHSEKVSEYVNGICNELKMPKDFIDMIAIAAYLHDYGKIAVEDNILKKSSPLTDDEYETIKTHAQKSGSILMQIDFEGIYKEIPRIVTCHHEKLDGSGYPSGLKGNQIPLGARIITVADIFEAVTSHRHYRGPMKIAEAFEVIMSMSGTCLDKNVIEAFIRFYSKKHGPREETAGGEAKAVTF